MFFRTCFFFEAQKTVVETRKSLIRFPVVKPGYFFEHVFDLGNKNRKRWRYQSRETSTWFLCFKWFQLFAVLKEAAISKFNNNTRWARTG